MTSCEFHCSVGNDPQKAGNQKDSTNSPTHKEGASIYNGIKLTTHNVKLEKAFLITANDGKRIADDNFVDFSQPVKLVLIFDSAWVENDGKVVLGASEKMTNKSTTLLDEKDLFAEYESGIDAKEAKTIALSVTLNLPKGTPPTDFDVVFRIWDKRGDGLVEGSYKLYSK